MKLICPFCGIIYDIDDSFVGKKVECECGNKWTVEEKYMEEPPESVEIETFCPFCRKHFNVDKRYLHDTFRCKFCYSSFIVDYAINKKAIIRLAAAQKAAAKADAKEARKSDGRLGLTFGSSTSAASNSSLWGCFLLVFVIIVIFFLIPACPSNQNHKQLVQQYGDPIAAEVQTEYLIKANLKAPSTAKITFTRKPETRNPNTVDARYRFSGYVDAQNSFGAMIRTNFVVNLEYKNGKYLPYEFKME